MFVGYNAQVAVDTEHHLIVNHAVTNVGSARRSSRALPRRPKATLQTDSLEAVADRGYFSGEEILTCDQAGITVTLPKPITSGARPRAGLASRTLSICRGRRLSLSGERLKYYFTNGAEGLSPRHS